jgi:hypothetical protein
MFQSWNRATTNPIVNSICGCFSSAEQPYDLAALYGVITERFIENHPAAINRSAQSRNAMLLGDTSSSAGSKRVALATNGTPPPA